MPKKEKKEAKPKAPRKPKGIIEVGVPGKIATVDKGVKEVLHEGVIREVAGYVEGREEDGPEHEDSFYVLNSEGRICTIYLK